MFERFSAKYSPTPGASGPFPSWSIDDTRRLLGTDVPPYTEFMRQLARSSFGGGLIRFLSPAVLPAWNSEAGWQSHWRQWSSRLTVISVDWRGHQIGFDRGRLRDGQPLLGMLEVGSGEYFQIPASFEEYLDVELVEFSEESLAAGRYADWLSRGGLAPKEGECVGYSQPLFLGGADSFDNMGITDLNVYVDIHGQLYEKVAGLPLGTKVGGFEIGE
jgi:hypothetical protein